MQITRRHLIACALCAGPTLGKPALARDYVADPDGPWRFLSDRVMGGVSEGSARVADGAIVLEGTVSTANRGGFIQVRTELSERLSPASLGLRLTMRGNGARYFVHLRTRRTRLPWHYYQASFETGPDWRQVGLPFTGFRPSGPLLPGDPSPGEITSIGLAAFGRDHEAYVVLRQLEVVSER